VVRLAQVVLKKGLPKGVILNVNVPNLPKEEIKGYRFTKQGKRNYGEIIAERMDPRGRKYYWIGGDQQGFVNIPGSDCNAVLEGYIAVCPLLIHLTDQTFLKELSKWKL